MNTEKPEKLGIGFDMLVLPTLENIGQAAPDQSEWKVQHSGEDK